MMASQECQVCLDLMDPLASQDRKDRLVARESVGLKDHGVYLDHLVFKETRVGLQLHSVHHQKMSDVTATGCCRNIW